LTIFVTVCAASHAAVESSHRFADSDTSSTASVLLVLAVVAGPLEVGAPEDGAEGDGAGDSDCADGVGDGNGEVEGVIDAVDALPDGDEPTEDGDAAICGAPDTAVSGTSVGVTTAAGVGDGDGGGATDGRGVAVGATVVPAGSKLPSAHAFAGRTPAIAAPAHATTRTFRALTERSTPLTRI
jgi:hypothetical protein